MAKGGARARSGPPPDPNALRRDRPSDQAGWVTLPAEGREGDAPAWPLTPNPSSREVEVWERLWRRPQAVMWERDSSEDQVALYVRRFCESEQRDVPVALSTLVKQLAEDLGISQDGLARRRWKIAAATPATAATPDRVEDNVVSARDRFRKPSDGTGA